MQYLRLWLLKRLMPAAFLSPNYKALHVTVLVPRRLFVGKVTLKQRADLANHVGNQAHLAAAKAVNNTVEVDWEAVKRARKEA